ncbi:PPE domain-containing protein [Saccharothrix deserti]|uniref:PPE domain-containing protein n=1 Tax=Saccharothrix deserti TaxID=2593674 RepID=UPI00131D3310|nr:PPE domain-containing protein [Saccharothrix deserti]
MAEQRLQRDVEIDLVLTDTQNWASRSHRELYDAVHNNNDPGQTGEIGSEWGQFGTELTEAARLINERVAVSESGWTGDAADAARLAIKGLADWVTHTAETAVEVGKRVQDESQIMENARASMPEPVEFDWDQAAGTFTAGGISGLASSAADVQAANDKARALHEHAVTVMSTMEKESRAVDQTTPQFSAPFNPVTGRTEEPKLMLARTASAPTLGDVADSGSAGGGATATRPSGYMAAEPRQMTALQPMESTQASQPVQPASTQTSGYTPAAPAAYQPGAGSYSGGGSGAGTYASGAMPASPTMPATPATQATPMYRPEGTTAAAAAAQVPVANPYTPPSGAGYTPSGGNYTPPGGGYNPPGGGQVPAYQPANPNTVPRQGGGTLPPGVKPPNYIPAGSPGTPPVTGTPGGGGGGAGAGRMPGGGMPPGGFGGGGGGFGGGGGAGGFGPTGSGGAGGGGGSMAAGGSTGAVGGQGARGPMPAGGFGPGGAGAASPMAGGAPMGGGAPAGGQQGEDKEHRAAAYIRGEDIFEVPGENLPPSVIGGAKPRKKGDQP